MANVDPFVLARFPLTRVLKQLIAIQGVAQTPLALYQQLWDATDQAPALFPGDPHCNDPHSINDFKLECPAPDAALKRGVPADFTPVALTNRFDLAPKDGAHCGEYRIVYARTGNSTGTLSGRDFVIFEGVLPNPNPSCGIESCRPVVKFWESLASLDPTTAAGQQALADGLDKFYFSGLPGFAPVVHPGHYGMNGGVSYNQSGGQIRTNMFFAFQRWRLRENHLVLACPPTATACHLQILPVTVKTNPFPDLFDALSAEPRTAPFESAFPSEVATLAADNISKIGMTASDKFNAGESNSQIIGSACGPAPAQNDDDQHCVTLGAPPNPFTNAVAGKLTSISRTDLSTDDVFRRSTTQTCAGCHQISNFANLGGGSGHPNLVWPSSRGFVHIDEQSFLSPALWCEFLPFRKRILDGFFGTAPQICPSAGGPAITTDSKTTLSDKPVGAAN